MRIWQLCLPFTICFSTKEGIKIHEVEWKKIWQNVFFCVAFSGATQRKSSKCIRSANSVHLLYVLQYTRTVRAAKTNRIIFARVAFISQKRVTKKIACGILFLRAVGIATTRNCLLTPQKGGGEEAVL